ncbi:ATP-binding protein [Ferrovibrio terrae]|uniref:sensor histidine kinase n=1 Tax=Ferrovibrio terrae TaxID=2594003 RepID=UPI0031376F29
MLLLASVMAHYTWLAIDNLDDVSLQIQAEQIAENLQLTDGAPTLRLPENLQRAYDQSSGSYLYALIDSKRNILIASEDKARDVFSALSAEQLQRPESYFRLINGDGSGAPYYVLQKTLVGRPDLHVVVAQGHLHSDVYIDTLLTEFASHIGWTLPIILIGTLLFSVWTIRTSLRPIKDLSDRARMIRPETRGLRLPTSEVSDEMLPLIQAINTALDRFEKGFEVQRRFTANAAHELRTPLALLTARLDQLEESATAQQLASDIERMSRLVAQLLLVSRLENTTPNLEPGVDLNVVGETVVALMAPLAIAQNKAIALRRASAPVTVLAMHHQLEDAVRNLIENAISHTPPGTEVDVWIGEDGSLAVRDHGPGVPADLRERIFERFWRGRERSGGAGLGLAIVAETMRAHGGRVSVEDAHDGGAVFTLHLQLDKSAL